MSAAILFSGSLSAKALHIFEIMNVHAIARTTFFRHQKKYLQPAVHSVWTRQQQSIFQILKENGTPLALAGDGRADSPGHSAKYGTYSLLDVNCKKIIITQLVAVSKLVLLVIDIYIPIIYSPVKSRAVTIWRKKA